MPLHMRDAENEMATGVALSRTQAAFLSALRWTYTMEPRAHYNTWRSLRRMGLVTLDGPTRRTVLTDEGKRIADLLEVACEYGATHAMHVRTLGVASYDTCHVCHPTR